MKRSAAVKLIMMGAGALSLYAIYREDQCRRLPPEQQQGCRSGSSRSSGGRIWSSSSSGASRASSSTGTAPQGIVSRGGFGSVSRAISSSSFGS